jgi:hypothetical protein
MLFIVTPHAVGCDDASLISIGFMERRKAPPSVVRATIAVCNQLVMGESRDKREIEDALYASVRYGPKLSKRIAPVGAVIGLVHASYTIACICAQRSIPSSGTISERFVVCCVADGVEVSMINCVVGCLMSFSSMRK